MSSQGGGSTHDLIVESWIMYGVGILFFIVRLYARYKRLKFHFQIEDYLMFLAIIFYTAFVVTNIEITNYGSTLYEPGQFETFTAHDIELRVLGSKIEFASEHCQVCTIYCLKACMLLVYFRITSNLKQHRWVKACAVYTVLGWLATELTLFLNCHPVSGYWTLPPPQRECATYFNFEVVQAVFNISSDITILLVVLPMLFRARMPLRTKLPILVVFSMGIVVILCAIISKIFTFRNIYDTSYQFWYLREASIGVWVTNAPFVWSLARSTLSFLKSSSNPTKTTPQYGSSAPGASVSRARPGTVTRSSRTMSRIYDMEPTEGSEDGIIEMDGRVKDPFSSAASIDDSVPSASEWGEPSHREPEGHIWKTTEITIQKS
ncbi:hypothetical protein PITC_033270 [Penicillium italicum]|uniref:Rhodopsin domain-containing protein n=1 Tax=Penicillium italicum TaxID=40296 RepID=A0A0A2L9M4_PENIT|nr:hypothetical protein PITC_033270 [Penicillium italicum]